MKARFFAWLHAYLVALDQLWFVKLSLVPTLRNQMRAPSPYETISSFTGRAANGGWRWAIWLQPKIDWLFEHLVGSQPNHCQRMIVSTDLIRATLP